MAKRVLRRKFRQDPLTAAQSARDEEIRRQVEAEFPPLELKSESSILCDPLKEAIAQSRKSVRTLALEANVSPIILAQFLAGERDLRLTSAEKLARLLGLKLVAG